LGQEGCVAVGEMLSIAGFFFFFCNVVKFKKQFILELEFLEHEYCQYLVCINISVIAAAPTPLSQVRG
jgi:hypothetical protein